MAKAKTKANRPKPPEEIEGEALLEWERVCDELEALGRLDAADRAILTVYVQTWQVHHTVSKHVSKHGPVIKWHNGVIGPSPFYKVQKEQAALLRGLLEDLGLTPASRGFGTKDDDDTPNISF